ncbi:MAG TPA: hypothetical protein DEP57_00285 [Selenomonas sp.]|nr:hypothetical protein [Selenomonas sp.]
MKRLSLSELKVKQAELNKKIEEAEDREKNLIGDYMQKITGECELEGIKKWIKEHTYDKNEAVENIEHDVKLHVPLNAQSNSALV